MKGLPSQESTKQTGVKYAQFSLVGVSNALVDLGVLKALLLLEPPGTRSSSSGSISWRWS